MMQLASHILSRPVDVLPEVSDLLGPVAVDTETSGLYTDAGARVCAVSLSFRLRSDPDTIVDLAFPFDQGRHEVKGFAVQRYKRGDAKGVSSEEELTDWLAEYNLGPDDWRYLCNWLVGSGREVGHVYQNAQFDLLMIDAGLRTGEPGVWLEPYVVWDTMLASKTLWPTEPTGLKPTGERLWGKEAVADAAELKDALVVAKKLFGLRAEHGPRYDLVPWSINGKYAASDTSLTYRLREVQIARMEDGEGNGWAEFERAMNLMRVLARMSRRGLGPYSVGESHEWANAIAARIAEIEPNLPFACDEDGTFVSASAARASEFYFEKLGYAPWKVGETPRGFEVGKGGNKRVIPAAKSDRSEIERRFPVEKTNGDITFKQGELTASIAQRLAAEGAPGATEYAEYLRLKIANQMFYRNYAELAGTDHRLRPIFRQAHVKSGRMSVEHFQAQALPKRLELELTGHPVPEPRAFFGVAEGRERWNLDLGQAELRIGSHMVDAKPMYELLDTGSDLHGETCRRLFGIEPDHRDWSARRDLAKRANFGLIFNMGAPTFRKQLWKQAGVDMPLGELQAIVRDWRALYPEFGDAWRAWHDYARDHGCVKLYNGERSWFGRLDYPNTALNRVIQGSLAAWVAEWLVLVEQITQDHNALVLTVHDSAVLDLPADKAEEIVAEVVDLSQQFWVQRFGFPGKVDADPWEYHKGVDLTVPPHLAAGYETCYEEKTA